MATTSRIVSVPSATPRDLAQWSELRDRALEPYPFLDPRMVMASLPHMALAQDLSLLFVEEGDDLLAIVPITVTRLASSPHARIVSTRAKYLDDQGGWHHPLIDASRAEDAFAGIFVAMKSHGLPRLVEFSRLPLGGPLEGALIGAADRHRVDLVELERTEFVYSPRPSAEGSPEAAENPDLPNFGLPHQSLRTRKNQAREARQLEHELGTTLRIEERGADPTAISDFIELQASGWKGDQERGGHSIRTERMDDWFRQAAARYRADNALLVLALVAGDQVLHMSVQTRIGDEVFAWQDAYDERYAEFRAGVLGRVACMNRTLATPGVRLFDPNFYSATGEASRLFSARGHRATILAANGSAMARGVVAAIPAARSFRKTAKSALRRG